MSDQTLLLSRIEKAVGPSAATMFVESGDDRRLIPEITAVGVALYILTKYLDGFMEGLGVKELGKQHGHAVAEAAESAFTAFSGDQPVDRTDLDSRAAAVADIVEELRPHRTNSDASARGLSHLRAVLEDRGVPRSEAMRIAEEVEVAIWLS